MSKKRGRGEGPSAEKIAEDQLRWATFFAAENDNVLDAYSLEPLDPTVNNNAHAVHSALCTSALCRRAQASEYTERSKVLQRKDAASSKYFYQRREKEDGKGKESRAGESGAGAGDG